MGYSDIVIWIMYNLIYCENAIMELWVVIMGVK